MQTIRLLNSARTRLTPVFKWSRPSIAANNNLILHNTKSTDAATAVNVDRHTNEKAGEISESQIVKPLTNEPFVKNLFLGNYDKNMLVYPEITDNEELEQLNELVAPLEKLFNEEVDSKLIDETSTIPDSVWKRLKEFGLLGIQIPQAYGGLELSATEFARIFEIIGCDGAIATALAAHQSIGLKGILIAGTDEQKMKYLPKFASGEHVCAFCLTEPGAGSDVASLTTRATLSEDGSTYYVSGSKCWITNGGIADVYITFAKTEITDSEGNKKDKVTGFIIDRNAGGITTDKPENKLGIRGSNTCQVHFDNTPVPVSNVLGEVGNGFKLAMNILNSGRFSMGAGVAGIMKKLMNMISDQALNRVAFNKKLAEFELIQDKFAKMAVSAYAIESATYLTSLTIDSYEKPDCSVEAAIVKVFSSEQAWIHVSEALQVMGGSGFVKDYPYERLLRDCRILLIYEGTNEILRMFIALNGVQFAGKQLQDLVRKMRDPLNNMGTLVKQLINRVKVNRTKPAMILGLKDQLHPNFHNAANELESRVLKFKISVENILQKHGNKIIDKQMELKRLADIAIDIYVMTAVIGRASRSICIGLRNHDYEKNLANAFCFEACKRIDRNLEELQLGFNNIDDVYKEIADGVFKAEGYPAEHPLTRNW
ncbi:complex I assembly factor ACAD9, mitochondrial-like [Tubulanus polymorphus]|uniref:complex I assembly factor ACAD9, mitochondrial-like n=1 Tax=Tubulanus polymorphus TaxID=672921 RepID=UPI003DA34B73